MGAVKYHGNGRTTGFVSTKLCDPSYSPFVLPHTSETFSREFEDLEVENGKALNDG